MPVRSSICTYSPSASSSKYSSGSPSSLSVGHYKTLLSSSGDYLTGRAPTTIGGRHQSYSTYSSLPSSVFKPSATSGSSSASSSSSCSSSSTSSYRPLSYAHSSLSADRHLSSPAAGYSAGSSAYGSGSGSGSRYSSSSSSSLSGAGSLLERTENLLSSTPTSGYSSSAIGSYLTCHPSASSTNRRRISRTSFDGSSSTDSSPVSGAHYLHNQQRSPRQQVGPQLPNEVPRGLLNLGNTCYMNSALQSLYSIDSFRALILASRSGNYDKPILSELSNLFRSMKDSSVPLSPRSFHNVFSRQHQAKFTEYHQQDAQEFLRYLINSVHEECNQAASSRRAPSRTTPPPRAPKSANEAWSQYREIVDDSPFVDLLVGQMCSTITCTNCQNKSLCWDPFWDLSLPLQRGRHYGSFRLSDVIDDFCAKETLDGDERPICGHCKKATRSTKQIKLCRLPRLLILHLKKFSNDGYKLTSPDVSVDKTLSLNELTTYQLSACISHHGHSSSSGHYTSHCRYSTSWFHFNDDRVRDVTSSFDSAKLEDAYVLFYTQQQPSTIINNHQQSKL